MFSFEKNFCATCFPSNTVGSYLFASKRRTKSIKHGRQCRIFAYLLNAAVQPLTENDTSGDQTMCVWAQWHTSASEAQEHYKFSQPSPSEFRPNMTSRHSSIPNSKLSYFSKILPSIDIWHLFGLISRIPGLLYGFFLCFSFFLVFSYRFSFRFSFSVLGLLSLP